jgi:hypothetical protein
LDLSVLPFGTGIRLLWLLQLAYGGSVFQGKFPLLQAFKSLFTWFHIRYFTGKLPTSTIFESAEPMYLQVRVAPGPDLGRCVLVEIKCIALGNIAALVTDVVLILIMLLGLFRMRRDAGGSMALGRLLWNQVAW